MESSCETCIRKSNCINREIHDATLKKFAVVRCTSYIPNPYKLSKKDNQAIKDSGERREFDTGAVRDVDTNKGRCDLLPLDQVAKLVKKKEYTIIYLINEFIYKKQPESLKMAIEEFCEIRGWDIYTGMLEVAIHYADGLKKYPERNWQKGIPLHSFLDSGVRHLLKHFRGDTDERHDRAFLWNMLGALWTFEHMKELDDINV